MNKGAVGIIEREVSGQKQYLLISAITDFGEFTGFYYPPGGHVEDGEKDEETIVREIKEELGFDVETISKIAETPGDVKDILICWWLCRIIGGEQCIQKQEIADVRWFTEDEIKEEIKIFPATKKFFSNYIFVS